ncbi:hypothetical protein B0H10DRAFT_2054427 [Mycena sp. CBHHK59/15]|nr:hypothetical protein B0H10DRAFT_2054427 [Mycena sp. CBHHK59/15]
MLRRQLQYPLPRPHPAQIRRAVLPPLRRRRPQRLRRQPLKGRPHPALLAVPVLARGRGGRHGRRRRRRRARERRARHRGGRGVPLRLETERARERAVALQLLRLALRRVAAPRAELERRLGCVRLALRLRVRRRDPAARQRAPCWLAQHELGRLAREHRGLVRAQVVRIVHRASLWWRGGRGRGVLQRRVDLALGRLHARQARHAEPPLLPACARRRQPEPVAVRGAGERRAHVRLPELAQLARLRLALRAGRLCLRLRLRGAGVRLVRERRGELHALVGVRRERVRRQARAQLVRVRRQARAQLVHKRRQARAQLVRMRRHALRRRPGRLGAGVVVREKRHAIGREAREHVRVVERHEPERARELGRPLHLLVVHVVAPVLEVWCVVLRREEKVKGGTGTRMNGSRRERIEGACSANDRGTARRAEGTRRWKKGAKDREKKA